MKERQPEEFEVYLQRVIGPVAASPSRKQIMRDELRAHLFESYQAEMTDRTDELSAIQAAITRLGNADELRVQLQASVPRFERALFLYLNRKDPTMRLALKITSFAVVLLMTAWLAFSAAMIAPDLFRHYPEGSKIRVVNGILEVDSMDAQGDVIETMVEPWKPAVVPALAGPFAILVGFALFGCYSLSRKANHGETPVAEGA